MLPGKTFSHDCFRIFPALLIMAHCPYVYADHDTSLRTDLNFSYTLDQNFRSVSYIFLQADNDMSDLDYLEWDTGLQYQTALPWLSFLLYYQQGHSRSEENNWLIERKPSLNINTSAIFHHFKISNQIRYEYRFTPDWNDYRIKNTLEISRPDIFLQPYVGWELFYENRNKDLMLHRIKFGIVKNTSENVYLGTYYRIDFSNVNDEWQWRKQLIGIQLSLKY